MRKTSMRTLILAAVILTILVYFAQMLNVTQTKKTRVKQTPRESPIPRIDSPPVVKKEQHVQEPGIQELQPKEDPKSDKIDMTIDRELDIYQNESQPFESRMDNIGQIRRRRISETCVRNKLGDNKFDPSDLKSLKGNEKIMVSDKYKVIFCSTGDVNSDNWKKLLLDEDIDGSDQLVELRPLTSYREESVSYRLKYYYKFMVVQEPLVRILAAYKSWLLPHPNYQIDESLAFLAKEMDNLSHKIRLDFDPENFYNREPNATNYARLSDFVAYIINQTKSGNPLHPIWERYHVLCQPCVVPYDYVMRPEAILDEARYVLTRFEGASEKVYSTGHMDSSDSESIREIRDEITSDMAETLYEIYRNDFELFGYPKSWN